MAGSSARVQRQKPANGQATEHSTLRPHPLVLAVTSLVFWLGAIASGRLLSYIGTF